MASKSGLPSSAAGTPSTTHSPSSRRIRPRSTRSRKRPAGARAALSPEAQAAFRPDAHTHLRLQFESGGPEVMLRDVRKFGKVQLLAPGQRSQRLDRLGIEEIAELGLAEEIGKKGTIERQGGGSALRNRCVVVVHERGNEIESERRRKRARSRQVELNEGCPPLFDVGEHLLEGRHIEVILEEFSVRLEHDGERSVSSGDVEQVRCLSALEPEGRARARSAASAADSAPARVSTSALPTAAQS